MNKMETYSERRNHTRFEVKPGAFTVFSPKSVIPGRITNISMGGLAFRYVDGEQWYNESSRLDILFGDDDFYLEDLPFETISDTVIKNESPYSQIIMRQCGVKFGKLTEEQITKLKYFIRQNTTDNEEAQSVH